eukprot:scaffold10586_cov46-Attheya_sp.AAC.2
MAKKKSNKKGTKSRPSVVLNANQQHIRAGESTAELKNALRKCSFDRIRAIYPYMWPMIEILSKQKERRITDTAMDDDPVTTRAIIESQLISLSGIEPYPPMLRNQIKNQIRSMGGIKISIAKNVEQRLCAYASTCGFTAVGGKELLIQNVHRSVISISIIGPLFYRLYDRHTEGHPLAHGQEFQFEEIVYKVEAPDRIEATLIKASKMLEPTGIYGLAGFNILLIIPIGTGTRLADAPENRSSTHEEDITLTNEWLTDDVPFRSEPNPAKLRLCAWCHKSKVGLENNNPMKKCADCNNSFYCSREHQKIHWKEHKTDCMRLDEDAFKFSMGMSPDTTGTLEGARKIDGRLSDEERFQISMSQALDFYRNVKKNKK